MWRNWCINSKSPDNNPRGRAMEDCTWPNLFAANILVRPPRACAGMFSIPSLRVNIVPHPSTASSPLLTENSKGSEWGRTTALIALRSMHSLRTGRRADAKVDEFLNRVGNLCAMRSGAIARTIRLCLRQDSSIRRRFRLCNCWSQAGRQRRTSTSRSRRTRLILGCYRVCTATRADLEVHPTVVLVEPRRAGLRILP